MKAIIVWIHKRLNTSWIPWTYNILSPPSIYIDWDKVDNPPKLRVVIQKTGYENIRVFSNEDAEKVLDRKYLAIQCTNIGMHQKTDEAMRVYAELKAGMGIK